MVSFICDQCQDTVKKPKLDRHRQQCYGASFTCVDCNQHFAGTSYRDHVTCISEAEKYQKSLFRGKKAAQAGHPRAATSSGASVVNAAPASSVVAANGTASNGDASKKRKRDEADAQQERAAKKSKVSEESAKQAPETSEEVHSAFELNDLKWRRTIKRALKNAPGGRMQQSSLEGAVIDTLLQDSALRTRLQQLFKQKIRSSKYTVEGEHVALK
jgi:cell growth-regulating nucleolar protein